MFWCLLRAEGGPPHRVNREEKKKSRSQCVLPNRSSTTWILFSLVWYCTTRSRVVVKRESPSRLPESAGSLGRHRTGGNWVTDPPPRSTPLLDTSGRSRCLDGASRDDSPRLVVGGEALKFECSLVPLPPVRRFSAPETEKWCG